MLKSQKNTSHTRDNSFQMQKNNPSRNALTIESLDPQVNVITLGSSTKTLWDFLKIFGSGQTDTFKKSIEEAKAKNLEEAFMLAIGLARFDGNKEAFEDVAVEYATSFGNSPPDWIESHTIEKKAKVHQIILPVGNLTESEIIETIIKMETPKAQILDFANTVKSDAEGIKHFNEALQERLKNKAKTSMVNGDRLVKHFLEKVKLYPSKQNTPAWSFIFHYFRINNHRDLFDQASSAYASVGGDLPKWEDLSDKENQKKEIKHEPLGIIVGESLSSINADFAKKSLKTPEGILAQKEKKPLAFDMVYTKEGSLLNATEVVAFAQVMKNAKVQIAVFNVNEIFMEMFGVMGVDTIVQSMKPPGAAA